VKFNRDIVLYIIVAVICIAVLTFGLDSREVYNVSMLPTVEPGDYVMANRFSYLIGHPKHGDVVIINALRTNQRDLIKRVIALPGDSVEAYAHTVYVNDTALVEPYIMEPIDYMLPAQTIPEGSYFVLGDNRNNSNDSHNGWLVPESDITGKVMFVYWPLDRAKILKHFRQQEVMD
jgi:signal peptidase I